jgi:hypothetical protein
MVPDVPMTVPEVSMSGVSSSNFESLSWGYAGNMFNPSLQIRVRSRNEI